MPAQSYHGTIHAVRLFVAVIIVVPFLLANASADETGELDFRTAAEVLNKSCGECHGGDAKEGDFSLTDVAAEDSLRSNFARWQKMLQRISDRSMPPADSSADEKPLTDNARQSLAAWIRQSSLAAICPNGAVPGPPLLRRLARHEYSNSIRDLLNIHFDAGQGLPEDAAGGEGFNNAAETLTIAPIHAEKYMQAAVDALDYAAREAGARRRLLSARPGESQSEETAARINLRELAARAFRRPVSDEEVDRFCELYRAARQDELPFDDALLYAMRGILISPNFLFITESRPPEPDVAEPLSDHELAVRLSYFLWASSPDEELRQAADDGKLKDEEEWKKQTKRLLTARGTRLLDSLDSFVGNWLGTADLGRSKQVDPERYPWVKDPHVEAFRNQPVYAMETILQKNESILALIDASWTPLNDELVRMYKMRKEKLKEKFVQRLVKVELPDEYRYRGGLLGMGGVLTVSAYPRRSSPVLRGAWVLEKMLGVELPPPPPNVPALDESKEVVQARTLRARLEQHRQDAACASCHNRIDPIGFALENFDEIGRWRDKDDGGPIEPLARLADGTEINGIVGLKQYLMNEKDTFARVLTRKMLGYALGRSLQPTDLLTVESIVTRLRENDYRGQELVFGIVLSEPFRKKMISKSDKP